MLGGLVENNKCSMRWLGVAIWDGMLRYGSDEVMGIFWDLYQYCSI